jgi:CheY-like chemotaxis protein
VPVANSATPERSVLVVDDDALFTDTLCRGLTAAGYLASAACNGVDAIDLMGRRGLPDAVILDLSMPTMNGWEFLEELREDFELAEIPVVVLTGLPKVSAPHADAVLRKPASLDQVLGLLEETIRKRRGG